MVELTILILFLFWHSNPSLLPLLWSLIFMTSPWWWERELFYLKDFLHVLLELLKGVVYYVHGILKLSKLMLSIKKKENNCLPSWWFSTAKFEHFNISKSLHSRVLNLAYIYIRNNNKYSFYKVRKIVKKKNCKKKKKLKREAVSIEFKAIEFV